MKTRMTMTNEFISPEKAKRFLEKNSNNRSLSKTTIEAYSKDIMEGNWDERVGSAISIDENGILRDGQHRLMAIIRAGVGVRMWVCRNVSNNGIYDCNRKRSNADQVSILRPNMEKVYRNGKYISVARAIIGYNEHKNGRTHAVVTPKEVVDFTERHKKQLDGFWLQIPVATVPKVSITVVYLALFMAYMSGVEMQKILGFFDVLRTGMSTKQEDFPAIALRNYLKDHVIKHISDDEIGRVQYSLKKHISGSCMKKTVVPKELIYPYPFEHLDNHRI